MAAVLRGLACSPLAERYGLDFVTTYRHANGPVARVIFFARALIEVALWCLHPGRRVLHLHTAVRGSWYRKGIVVALARVLRRPVIVQVHSGAVDIAAFWDRIGPLRRRALRWSFGAADHVLSVSAAGAEVLRDRVGLEDVIVVGNAAPRPAVVPHTVRTADDGKIRVLYLGGFANRAKGGRMLTSALPTLLADDRLEVRFAGPGDVPGEAAALFAGNAVRWLAWLDDEAKAIALAEADIVVFPSISEGLPIALLEAMVAGRAIVAARTGGMPEILTDREDALLVPAGDSDALATAIRDLSLDREQRARLGARAAERAARLNENEVYAPLDELYRKLGAASPVHVGEAGTTARRLLARVAGLRRRRGRDDGRRPKALLVCSPGGHLQQMLALRAAWEEFDVSWATLSGRDVEYILADEDVSIGHGPTNRSVSALLRNLGFAWRVLSKKRPDVILSTGAGLAVPFFILGKARGCRLVYVESLTRTEGLSLSGRMIAPLADDLFVQWPGARSGKARYVGSILSGPDDDVAAAASPAGVTAGARA